MWWPLGTNGFGASALDTGTLVNKVEKHQQIQETLSYYRLLSESISLSLLYLSLSSVLFILPSTLCCSCFIFVSSDDSMLLSERDINYLLLMHCHNVMVFLGTSDVAVH